VRQGIPGAGRLDDDQRAGLFCLAIEAVLQQHVASMAGEANGQRHLSKLPFEGFENARVCFIKAGEHEVRVREPE